MHETGLTILYYGHTPSGERLWLISDTNTGDLEFGIPLQLNLFEVIDGDFGRPWPPETWWGGATILPFDCDTGLASLAGRDGGFAMEYVRLTGIPGTTCP